jgi:hypothetical protein
LIAASQASPEVGFEEIVIVLPQALLDNFWIADQSSEWHSFDAGRWCAQNEELHL